MGTVYIFRFRRSCKVVPSRQIYSVPNFLSSRRSRCDRSVQNDPDIGAGEILAEEQQRAVQLLRQPIGEAIAEIQPRRVPTLAVLTIGASGCLRPLLRQWDDVEAEPLEQSDQWPLRRMAGPNNQALRHRSCRNRYRFRIRERGNARVSARGIKDDFDE